MSLSGQLDYQSYQEFLESVKDWQKRQKDYYFYDSEGRKTFAGQMNLFLNDPTGISYFWENDLVANNFYDILTISSDTEMSYKSDKDKITWRHIPLPTSANVFLELYYHDHSSKNSPLSETWIKLVDKQGINNFLNKKNKSSPRYNLTDYLSITK